MCASTPSANSHSPLPRLAPLQELDQEKADLRAKQKALKKEHLQLLRDKRAKEARVSELEAKAYDVQMLKFGQVRCSGAGGDVAGVGGVEVGRL